SVESGVIETPAARPEAGRGNLAVIRFLRDVVRQRGYAARMKRRTPPRKSGDCEIEAPPEQVNGAGFTHEGRSEAFEHAVERDQGAMKASYGVTVVRTVAMVFRERHRVGDFVRPPVEDWRAAELRDQPDEIRMKRGNRGRREWKRCLTAVAAPADDLVISKVEQDLDAGAVGDQRRGQPDWCHIEGRGPRMVDPRRMGQPVLTGYLQIEMQGRTGLAPAQIIELRPIGVPHCISSRAVRPARKRAATIVLRPDVRRTSSRKRDEFVA